MRNVVVPSAGDGTRFQQVGYSVPKPFIQVGDKCMVEHVIDNIAREDDQVILILRTEHAVHIPKSLLSRHNIVFKFLAERTEGTACTILSVDKLIDNDHELLIANSDQFIEFDRGGFEEECASNDGVIMTFGADHPKWSYAKLDEIGYVSEVSEKQVISEHATCGVYYFKKGSLFCEAAQNMIKSDIRVNGEFYTCPVFNHMPYKTYVRIFPVKKMYGLGTPDDLYANQHVLLRCD